MDHNPPPKKAQLLPLFNVNLSQPQLNSTSTQFQLNFDSTSCQPHFNLSLNINLNSNSTLTSTQYGCDIKATQSCDVNSYSTSDIEPYHLLRDALQKIEHRPKRVEAIVTKSQIIIDIQLGTLLDRRGVQRLMSQYLI